MSNVWTDPVLVREIICIIACVGTALSSLEWLIPPAKLRPESLLAAESFGTSLLERLWRPHGLRLVFLLRLAAALTFLVAATLGIDNGITRASVLAAGLLGLPVRFRPPVGHLVAVDGAENMFTVILLSLGPTFLLGSPLALEFALAFVAAQACLEYAAAGWTKLRDWRGWVQGQYLLQVFASSNYGHPGAAAFLRGHRAVGGLVSSAVIVLEIAAPLALILPPPFAELLLLSALLFHAGTAVIMGLNTFVWAFLATYPAVLHCRNLLIGL